MFSKVTSDSGRGTLNINSPFIYSLLNVGKLQKTLNIIIRTEKKGIQIQTERKC